MLKIVLDTDVVFAAFHSSSGASRQLLLSALNGEFDLLLSTTLLVEYEAVLTRPANLTSFGIETQDVIDVLDELAALCTPVALDYRWRPVAADADDDMVIETAVNGTADVIASFNIADIAKAATAFGVVVERPSDLLRRMRR